jgi:hypothetical protein
VDAHEARVVAGKMDVLRTCARLTESFFDGRAKLAGQPTMCWAFAGTRQPTRWQAAADAAVAMGQAFSLCCALDEARRCAVAFFGP